MKKIISLIIVLVLASMLTLSVLAATGAINLSLSAKSAVVEPGDTVTVVISMDEAISVDENTTMIQMELNYDKDALTYVSHELGSGYDFITVVVSEREPVIKANWIDVSEYDVDALGDNLTPDRIVKALSAGTVVSVTFEVNSAQDTGDLVLALEDSLTASAVGEVTHNFASSVTITVCADHADDNGDGFCDECNNTIVTILLGDVNGDGKITSKDAALILKYIAGDITEDELVIEAADVNGDGKITSKDAATILKYIAGDITEFSVS